MCQSADRYGPDPGSQATFYDGHKITVLILPDCLSTGLSAGLSGLSKKINKITIFVLKIYWVTLIQWFHR